MKIQTQISNFKAVWLGLCVLCAFVVQSFATNTNTVTTATIAITNTAGTTNGMAFTLYTTGTPAGYLYTWTNTATTGFHYISTNSTAAGSATNLYRKLTNDWANLLRISYGSSTSVVIQTFGNGSLNVSRATNWATVALTTNAPQAGGIASSNGTFQSITLNGSTITSWPAGAWTNGYVGDATYNSLYVGLNNTVGGANSGTIIGGTDNRVEDYATYGTIVGGRSNYAGGIASYAFGINARATNAGAVVFSGEPGGTTTTTKFWSTGSDQFLVRAVGGAAFGTNVPGTGIQLRVVGTNKSDYFVGDGSGLTGIPSTSPTNWSVASITNAGTAAYSNSTAFYLTSNPAAYITRANAIDAVRTNANVFTQSLSLSSNLEVNGSTIYLLDATLTFTNGAFTIFNSATDGKIEVSNGKITALDSYFNGDGSGITNIPASAIISNGTYLVNGVLATNSGSGGGFLTETGGSRKYSLDGAALTNLNVSGSGALTNEPLAVAISNSIVLPTTNSVWIYDCGDSSMNGKYTWQGSRWEMTGQRYIYLSSGTYFLFKISGNTAYTNNALTGRWSGAAASPFVAYDFSINTTNNITTSGTFIGNGANLTNIPPSALVSNGTFLVNGILATNSGSAGFLTETGGSRKYSLDGGSLTNVNAAYVNGTLTNSISGNAATASLASAVSGTITNNTTGNAATSTLATYVAGAITNNTTGNAATASLASAVSGTLTNSTSGNAATATSATTVTSAALTNTIPSTNITSGIVTWVGGSNAISLNNSYQLFVTSTNVSITNVSGLVSGEMRWTTLVLSNSASTPITNYVSAPCRAIGASTTNSLAIPAAKVGIFSFLGGNNITNFSTVVQQ